MLTKLECCECGKIIGFLDPFFKDSETPGWCQGNEHCVACAMEKFPTRGVEL